MKEKFYYFFQFSEKCIVGLFILNFVFFSEVISGQVTTVKIDTHTGSGTWTVPCGVTSITVGVWGGGGAGGGSGVNSSRGGGGGAGGAYASSVLNVTPGAVLNYSIGSGAVGVESSGGSGGDTWFFNASTLLAKGGAGGIAPNGTRLGGVGTTVGSIGMTVMAGANGGNGSNFSSGAGGQGANGGGAGGAARNSENNGANGLLPGGGGSGAYIPDGTNHAGGSGGNGQIVITYGYCVKSFGGIDPITNVTFSGINNTTSNSSTVSNEFFCSTAIVDQGSSYPISIKANTNGNYTDYFTVYFDWNRNGIYGDVSNEVYNIGSVTNSTGIDAVTLSGTIAVPATALAGYTKMRVVGKYSTNTSGPCTSEDYGQAEDYVVQVLVPSFCSGTPTGGTTGLSATTGNPNSTFTASVSGGSSGASFTYQWQSAPSSTGPWTDISGATGSGSTTITASNTETTTYYRRVVTCTNSGLINYSTVVSFTTLISYCTPNFNNTDKGKLYINSFQFVGVLNDPPVNSSGFASGYQDFTALAPIAEQPQGAAVNIVASRGTNSAQNGTWKAWVDWNKDGDFLDAGEEVYNMISFTTSSVTFGFVIPVGQSIGDYRLRIGTFSDQNTNFTSCSTNAGFGEMEDYIFKVVTDCPAKILSVNKVNPFDGERCGPGSVRLSATGNASATNFKWYDYDPVTKVYTYLATGLTYNTAAISSTHTYYVKAVTGLNPSDCETAFYYPVEARIDPDPTVTFSTSETAICGEDVPSLLVNASGDKYQDEFFEDFSTGLGVFSNDNTESGLKSTLASWQNKPTPYIPTIAEGYEGLSPAMSSGYFGGNYAMINSDIDRSSIVKYHLVSGSRNVSGFLNLQLDFDLYHFSIAYDNTEGYFEVSYTLDGSVASPTWIPLSLPGYTASDASSANPTRYWVNVGNPLKWKHFTVSIPGANFTASNFKIRFTHFSQGQVTGGAHPQKFYEAITTVDNVRLSGFKLISTPFNWSSGAVTLYDTDCTTPIGSSLGSTVCIKPTDIQKEDVNWSLNASATFSNGCPAIGSFTVNNDTKIWERPGITDWNQGSQWKPSTLPTISKCVIVKTPVELPTGSTGSQGLARSVIVKSGGKLTVSPKSSLTIQNYIKNEAAVTDVVVESDANLVQNNNSAVNSGQITVRRIANLKRLDYNLWGSPVVGQNVKAFSLNTLDSRFYVYNESNDYFDGLFVHNLYPDNVTSSQTPTVDKNTYQFITGKGYGVRASNILTSTVKAITHEFKGVPFNGIVDVPLVKSTSGNGYNLISNPYPSSIDFYSLHNYVYNSGASNNASLIFRTTYFWTNTNYNPKMQGSSYPSNLPSGTSVINNYAVLNGTGGVGAPYGFTGTGGIAPVSMVPVQYIKPGQGFIVKAKGNGNLRFENGSGIRSNDTSGIFFNRVSSVVTKDRFWLSLKTPLDFVSPILIGYVNGASDGYEEDYDAELMVLGGDSFYSILEDKKLGIQGRQYPMNVSDSIPLGARFGLQGQYEIFIENKEGVFASQQPIYLKDNVTGVVTDLSQGKYVFTANAGESVDRFEIQYTNQGTLHTSVVSKKALQVYLVSDTIVIESPIEFEQVKVYDSSGRLVYQKLFHGKSLEIDVSRFVSGVYAVQVQTSGGIITKRVIK